MDNNDRVIYIKSFSKIFLPGIRLGYIICPKKFRNFILLIGSLVFYAWGEPVYIFLMIFTTIFNYLMALCINVRKEKEKKTFLIITIVVDLLILGYFKYYGFLIETINSVFSLSIKYTKLSLPIGISFYTFQTLSYVIDVYLKKVKRNKWKIGIIRIAILVIFIALWEVAAKLKLIDPFLTSSPSRIVKSLISFVNGGTLFRHIWVTCYETIIGFMLGTILGVIIAIILWASKTASKVLDPYLVVLNALPKVALAPIIIFWVGNGTPAIITIALLISIVTTIISVLTGFNEVDEGKMLLMTTFQANKWQKLRYLVFPASIPVIISALKINVGLSWVGVIMGEFLVAREGLGFLIIYGGQIAQLDMVMMSIVILSVIAFIMYEVVAILENKLVNKKK